MPTFRGVNTIEFSNEQMREIVGQYLRTACYISNSVRSFESTGDDFLVVLNPPEESNQSKPVITVNR